MGEKQLTAIGVFTEGLMTLIDNIAKLIKVKKQKKNDHLDLTSFDNHLN